MFVEKKITELEKKKDEMSDFQKNLILYRKMSGLTQKELATKLQISPTTLAGYENAGKEPKVSTLIKLADFFGVSVDNLVRETPKNLKDALQLRDYLYDVAVKSFQQFETTSKPVQLKLEILPRAETKGE